MAHMLDTMFSVRELPWHGLGTVLDEYPTSWDEARKLAGLDWEPIESPVYRRVPFINDVGLPDTRFEEIPGSKLLERSDNGKVLAVNSESYSVFKNAELGPLVETILAQSGGRYEYETAGSLDEGRKVWALIRAAEPVRVAGDPRGDVLPFVAIQNSHDGSGALRVQRTRVRIVCANTSHAADLDADKHGMAYTFRHTVNMHQRIELARQVLAGMAEHQLAAQEWAAELIAMRVSETGRRAFVEMLIPMPVGEVITERVRTNIENARGQVWGFLNSVTCEGIDRTAYGLVQAAVEYLDHGRKARSAETRFTRSMLRVEPMKRAAEMMAREAATL